MGERWSLVDLKKAYLQIKVDPSLWCFQAISWKGLDFLLTRLGFGLCSAPKIMTCIVEKCLNLFPGDCSSYIDDVFVPGGPESAIKVRAHLAKLGLESKNLKAFK